MLNRDNLLYTHRISLGGDQHIIIAYFTEGTTKQYIMTCDFDQNFTNPYGSKTRCIIAANYLITKADSNIHLTYLIDHCELYSMNGESLGTVIGSKLGDVFLVPLLMVWNHFYAEEDMSKLATTLQDLMDTNIHVQNFVSELSDTQSLLGEIALTEDQFQGFIEVVNAINGSSYRFNDHWIFS